MERFDQWTVRKPAVTAAGGVVSAQHVLAARAGAEMLAEGGNAVDAAVGAALALTACEPWMCGLGGSGFMVIWLARERRAVALDYQGVLAAALDPNAYPLAAELPATSMGFPAVEGFRNTQGYGAITVPGAVAGFDHAARNFGKLGFGALCEPAIRLAESGVSAGWYTTLMIASEMAILRNDPVSAAIYLPDGCPLEPGNKLLIPGLADTLRALGCTGAEGFYRGALAASIVGDLQRAGSRITAADLADYREEASSASSFEHRGTTLYTPGPQSGGARLRDMMAHVAAAMPHPDATPTAESWRVYAAGLEAAWRAHRLRNGTLAEVGASTSSLATADSDGNMVALTYTLLDHFGSGVTLPETGICMNNGVSYFDPRPGLPTSMRGGKRINSSNMCPTVACRGGAATFAIGASGGDLIMPCVAQLAALMLDFGLSLEEAFHTPRIDASHRGSVRVDPRLGSAVLEALQGDYQLEIAPNIVMPKDFACPTGVARSADGFIGCADPFLPEAGAAGHN